MSGDLRELGNGVWVAEQSFRFFRIEIGGRMAVLRVGEGDLFVYSPIALTPAIDRELERLGRVKFVLAPNRWHHLYLTEFAERYPEAAVWGAPGLKLKKLELPLDAEIAEDEPPPGWPVEMAYEVVRGVPAFNEVAVFHRPSRTLLLADIAVNISDAYPALTRFLARVNGGFGRLSITRDLNLLVRDRSALRGSMKRILAWDFDRVIVCHGDVVTAGGREALAQAVERFGFEVPS